MSRAVWEFTDSGDGSKVGIASVEVATLKAGAVPVIERLEIAGYSGLVLNLVNHTSGSVLRRIRCFDNSVRVITGRRLSHLIKSPTAWLSAGQDLGYTLSLFGSAPSNQIFDLYVRGSYVRSGSA